MQNRDNTDGAASAVEPCHRRKVYYGEEGYLMLADDDLRYGELRTAARGATDNPAARTVALFAPGM
jgi:hypothetical protein